jgi:hypothetical protein
VECSSAVADRAKDRASMSPNTPVRAAGGVGPATVPTVPTAPNLEQSADRPQKAGAGVAEWG